MTRRDGEISNVRDNAAATTERRNAVKKVKVVIYEDGEEVRALMVGYFPGQPYTVKIDTPDGVDRQYEGRA